MLQLSMGGSEQQKKKWTRWWWTPTFVLKLTQWQWLVPAKILKIKNTEYKTQKHKKYTQKGWGCCPVFEKREMLINDSG